MSNDILEESERSSIRGTLLGIASCIQVGPQSTPNESIDPYMRELRIWVHDGMSSNEVRQNMLEKLGLAPLEPYDASNMRFRTPNCTYHSICLRRIDDKWIASSLAADETLE